MINYNGLGWVDLDCYHRRIRDNYVISESYQDAVITYEKYRGSLKLHLFENLYAKQRNFEADYRRRSLRIELAFERNPEARAFIPTTDKDSIHISDGLVLAIEDAAQTITSDIRSEFASNIKDKILEDRGQFPGVIWSSRLSTQLDQFRFTNYKVAINFSKERNHVPYTLFFKFLSKSEHRRKLADFISSYSLAWVLAHEDAHVYLGHKIAFKKSNGFGAFPKRSLSFFEEFIHKNLGERNKTRLSSEVAADADASIYLVDVMAWLDAFEVYPSLNKYIDYGRKVGIFKTEEGEYVHRTIFLFRLCILSQVIALAVFERNTIKNSIRNTYYPSLATRILNCLVITSARFQDISSFHPERRIATFDKNGWQYIFRLTAHDIEIVLKYVFDIGFALHDSSISLANKEEVLDFSIGVGQLINLAHALNVIGDTNMIRGMLTDNDLLKTLPEKEKIEFVRETLNELYRENVSLDLTTVSHLDKLYDLMIHHSSYMLKYRAVYQKFIRDKVHESHEKAREIYDTFNLLKKVMNIGDVL